MDDTLVPDNPFLWWGPAGDSRPSRTLAWLVGQGTFSEAVAGLLAAAVANRLSLAVVAEPGGAGKTTLLTAALAHLPPDARRLYPRGRWETFAFLAHPDVRPERDALLVNEISPHLPGYLWGAGVGRLIDAARQGFPIYATAHAADAHGLSRLLSDPDLALPPGSGAAFHLVAAIDAAGDTRRVSGIWASAPARPGEFRAVLLGRGDATLAELETGLRKARRAGWAEDRDPPDAAAIADAIRRLDHGAGADDADRDRPGRMLARGRSTRPNGRAQLP